MSSVINFFKNKIKPFKKRTDKQQQQQHANCFEIESRLECTEPVIECCREKKVVSMKVNTSLKVKKRITAKNMFNLKQLKKATNTTNLIQRFISSDIVIVNKDYNLNNLNNNNKKETETSSVSSSFEWSSNKTELNYDLDETSSMLTYNSKYNNNNNNNRNILETPSSTEIELDSLFVSNRRTTTKRKKIILESQNLNRSLIDDDDESTATTKQTNVAISSNKHQKCRRSNTTAATSHHHNTKSNSIIDYYNKLELINPTAKRTKTFNYSDEAINLNQLKQFESESSLVSSVNNTKNEIEKIQDLFFEDDESLNTTGDGLNKLLNEKNIITSYLDSPVSATASSGHNDAKNNESCFFNVPSSSPTSSIESRSSTEQDEKNKSNKSVEKLRRSVSTPGLKEINASIFSNISNIQIKECAELVVEEEEEIEVASSLTEKEGQVNSIKPPQFIRGGKIRSSKNIKQLFKNVVKYQMNALNSLEKFYESQLNKLESDRKQNLNLNPVYADKINDFYDRQLSLLEERVQTNLKLICDNKRNRLSTASSSSTILVNNNNNELVYPVAVNNYLAKKNNNNNQINNNKSVKIVSNENEKTINVSRTLNDLKLNLKNQNSLLPSKKNAYKLNDSNDVSTTTATTAAATVVDNNKSTSETEYSKAKFFSPKIALLAQNNKFYKKQSVLQSPLPTDGRFKIETTPLNETNQYQRNRIKRYSTSNENLAQITKVHHIKNNMARIVKLNNTNNKIEQEPKILNLGFRYAKKHQSFCNLENEVIQFIEVKHENLNELIINDQFNTNNNIRMSDSHLMFELRQKKQAEHQNMYGMNYLRKTSKSFLFETNV